MPHIEIPSDLDSQTNLLDIIVKRVTTDGASGELVAFLAKKGIVLADDVAKGVTTEAHYSDSLSFARLGQKYCHERDVLIDPIIKKVSGSYQFLKALYTPDTKELGDWGATITIGGKITLPTEVVGCTTALDNLILKNNSYVSPAISPLKQYLTKNAIVLGDDSMGCAAAALKQDAMTTAKNNAKVAHHLMTIAWAIPLQHIRMIGKFLMKLYIGNEQALGDYGFKVVDAKKALKTRNIKIPYGFTKPNQRAKFGGSFINIGTETLHIYAGKTITGTPIILLAGGKLIVPKGYSSFCVTNTSAVNSAKLQIVPPKNVD